MLRSQVRKLFDNEKNRSRLTKVLRLVALVGFLWIFSFPQMSKEVFTSENAFDGHYLQSDFRDNPKVNRLFEKFKSDISGLDHAQTKSYLLNYLKQRSETYVQKLKTVDRKENIYSYIRSKDGYG